MPKIHLTDTAVERLRRPDIGPVDHWDTTLRGLGLRISPSGRRTFNVQAKVLRDGRWRDTRIKLGVYPEMSLAEARVLGTEYKKLARAGKDPRRAKEIANREKVKLSENTFGAVADLYIERYAKKRKRTWGEDKRILDVYVRPHWENVAITEITRADVVKVLDKVEAAAEKRTGKGHYMANRVLSVVRKMFNWAVDERALLDHTPIGKKMARGVEGSRKREFTDDEIRAIWNGAETIGGYKGATTKLLMLTGQRVSVIAGMKYSEVDAEARTLTVPGDRVGRSKNKEDHIIPLSDQAWEVFQSIPRIGDYEHVLASGAADKRPTIGTKLNNEFRDAVGFSDWCWQNLRGLVSTRMRRPLMISPAIINLVQGRVDSSVLSQHYDANDYLEDKTAALQSWANLLDRITGEVDADNIVPMVSK